MTNSGVRAADLTERVRNLRIKEPVGNAVLDLFEQGDLRTEHLRRLVGVEEKAHHAELAAYGLVMARFPHRPLVTFFAQLTDLVSGAQPKLVECARSLGMDEGGLRRWPAEFATYAFNGMLSWIAVSGSQAAAALALHTDMTVYFSGCADIVGAVRRTDLELPETFFSYYEGGHSDELMRRALDVVQDGLDRGDDPDEAVFQARLLEESIGQFWRAAASA